MSATRGDSASYQSLRDHSLAVQARWESIASAIDQARLPLTFYKSESSSAVFANEELDAAAMREFSPVTDWMSRIQSGAVFVRAVTDDDVDQVMASLESSTPTEAPEGSLSHISRFADEVLTVLQTMSRLAALPE
jgi:hypothetical protein